MRVIATFLVLLLAICSFDAFAQPGSPGGDPDAQVALHLNLSGNPNTVIDGGGGQISQLWVNPNHARVQDDAYATLTTTTKKKTTNYLLAQNFGFNIPAGSSIDGIVVQVDRFAIAAQGVIDSDIRIINAAGNIGNTNKSTGLTWPSSDTDTYQSYGGATDTWGITTWTSAQINNANFGVAIMAETGNGGTFDLFVDEIRITIYYTTGGADRYAIATGNWNSASTWSTSATGGPGASVPTAANDVFIGGGFTVTQNVNGAACNSLNIGTSQSTPTGRLTFDANNRAISIGAGGLKITSNGNILSTFNPTLTVAGDVTVDAALTNRAFQITINGGNSGILSGTGTLGRLNVQSFTTHTGTISITGEIKGPALHLINGSSAYLTYSGTTSSMDTDVLSLIDIGNTVEFSQTTTNATDFDIHKPNNTFYNLVISGNAPKYYNGDITITGNLTITATGILSNQNQQGITLFGNWTNNNGAAGFVPGTCNSCIVIFDGGNAQTISNAAGAQFNKVQVIKSSTTNDLLALNDIVITNELLMTAGDFDVGANSLTGTGKFTLIGGELIIGTTGGLVPGLTGVYTMTSGVITFNGAGPQTIRSKTSTPAIPKYKIVRFKGSGTKSLSGPIDVDTDLEISETAILDVTPSNFDIHINGDWTNTSTFVPQNGTVTFGGTATLFITNPNGAIYHNLTINNSAFSSSVLLKDPVTVDALLTLTLGDIISSDTSLLTLGPTSTVVSASDASHVSGPVAKTTSSTSVFVFPIGTGTNYMPASITPTSSASTTFQAQYFSLEQSVGTTENGIDHVSAQDYWTVQRTNGSADAAVTLVWKYPSAAEAEIDNLSDLLVAQWDGANWTSQGNAGTTGDFVAGSVKSNTISSFTQPYFVIGSSTANNPLSNYRYFALSNANWNAPGAWSYRPGGPTTAPEPTSKKFAVIPAGKTATILDSPSSESTKSVRSLVVLGIVNLDNSNGQDITINVGDHGFSLGPVANITGADIGDRIILSGDIALNNSSNLSHTSLETNFATTGNTITGSGGKLPILNVNKSNQTFTGNTSFINLIMGSAAINDGTVTITGSLTGGGTFTNNPTGTIIWQGTGGADNVIDATPPGNTVRLMNNTGGNLDIDDFVITKVYQNLILGGVNSFNMGTDVLVRGDLTIQPGAVFNISTNNSLNLLGNWTNDGAFSATTGTVFFEGNNTIGGLSTSFFNHVKISTDAVVTPPSTFNVKGNFTNDGNFLAGSGTVVFNGTAKQVVSGSVATAFNNISVTNSSTNPAVQIQSNQSMTGILTLSNNSVFDADGSSNDKVFTLLSTADDLTADASIAIIPAGASVTGQVTVQRYMAVEGNNSGRIYRYISSPVQNAPVSQIQAFIPVTGTFGGSSVCSGCGTAQSMFLYDETVITDINGSGAANSNDGYLNFPSTSNTQTFTPGTGYTIFVRANVAPILGFDSVVWSLRGPINSGNVSLPVTFTSSGTVANDGWNLVGNPYPSTIDWDAAGWTRANIDNTTYMLDNGLGSPVYATHVAGGASTNGATQYIATGQAFFVKSGGGTPSLQASESVKVAGQQTTFFRTQSIQDIMRVTLRQGSKRDETVIQFKPGATTDFDSNSDAHKLDNPTPMYNLATITSGTRYVINALPMPKGMTEIPLDLTSVSVGNYSMDFTEFESFTNASMTITLRDSFLGTTTNVRTNPSYSFQVTSDTKSFGSSRFTIVFEAAVTTGLELLDGSHITFFPNPTKNILNVDVRSDNEVSAKIISMIGTTLFEKNLDGGTLKKGSFNLEDQAEGIYILIVQDGAMQFHKRIIKK